MMEQTNTTSVAVEEQSYRGPAFHPVLIEVAGCMDDDVVRDVTQRLRTYRNRYTPLLRCMFTLVATAMPESRLFGDELKSVGTVGDVSRNNSNNGLPADKHKAPLFTAPRYAVTVNKMYPLVRRFYPSAPSSTNANGAENSSRVGLSTPAVTLSPVSPAKPLLTESKTSMLVPLLPWVDSEMNNTRGNTTAASHELAVNQLEDFMSYHFLPFAMTHNIHPSSPSVCAASPNTPDVWTAERTFILRHYINEASRTSSFLFADPYHTPCALLHADGINAPVLQAVLVDPREEQMEFYLADIAVLNATLSYIIFTHCYVDGSAGLSALVAHFPEVSVVSGLPLKPAGTRCRIPISSYLSLCTVAIPAFSPECLLVEVHADNTLVGLCTGTLWGTDAAPRWDLLHWTPYPATPQAKRFTSRIDFSDNKDRKRKMTLLFGGGDRDAALAHTHRVLREFLFDPYLAPLCWSASTTTQARGRHGKSARSEDDAASNDNEDGSTMSPAEERAQRNVEALQRVVLLPTHGGYSNVTNQLDLYWAAHLGDLCRMKHSRTVISTLAESADDFAKYHKRLPLLPHPPLFDASRVCHLRQLLLFMDEERHAHCVAQLPPDMRRALTNSFNPFAELTTGENDSSSSMSNTKARPQSLTSFVNVVDVRDAKDYHALHLSGSVNVPMSFPGVAYGARRAELWLQCVLVPHQPILALCATASQRAEVQRRLAALSPGCVVAVYTLDDLPHLAQEIQQQSSNAGGAFTSVDVPWREFHCERPRGIPAETPIPQNLVWVQHADALARLTTYEHLNAIEPADTCVVLDVRTPYEFKNGSHQHSVNMELSEMCALAVQDALQASTVLLPEQNHHHAVTRRQTGTEEVPWHVGSSPRLADVYMEKMHTTALLAGLPIVRKETSLSDVVLYCAGGYRSLIAASLLQRAMETSTNPAWRVLRITDVSGGAFQIMTQRPDLWRVKDRSIICIS